MTNMKIPAITFAALAVILIGCGGQGNTGFGTNSSTAGSLGLNGQPIQGPIGQGKAGPPGQAIDGDELMFAQIAEDGLQISLANPNSKAIGAMTRLPLGQSVFAQSPTGSLVVFSQPKDNAIGLFVNSSNSPDRAVALGASNFTSLGGAQFTPDAKRVVFSGAITGQQSGIYVANVDGKGFRKLDDGDDANLSPDGKRVVYTKFVAGTSRLFVIGLDGKGAKALTNDKQNEVLPQFTKDGKRVLYTVVGNEGMSVYVVPAGGGKPTKLALGFGATSSPDGKQIAFSRVTGSPEEQGIYLAGPDGKNPVKISDIPALSSPLYWTVPSAGPGRSGSQPGAPSASMSARAQVILKLPAPKPLPANKPAEATPKPEKDKDKDKDAKGSG